MRAITLASRTGLSVVEAQHLITRMERTFPVYTEWAQQVIGAGIMRGSLSTCFGWTRLTASDRTTTMRNWPVQSAGAEMLRLACNLIVEHGVTLCAPVHDAVMIEADADSIDEAVAITRDCMATASATLLDGLVIGTDAAVVTWPGRYADERGIAMWDTMMSILDQLEKEDEEIRGSKDLTGYRGTKDTKDSNHGKDSNHTKDSNHGKDINYRGRRR